MNRSCLFTLALLLLLGLALPPMAPAAGDPNSAYVEIGGNHDPNFGGAGGGLCLYQEHAAFLAGVSLFGSSSFDDLFVGANLGVRLHATHPFRSFITPFIGLGGFVGYSEEEQDAADDDIDNDEDGEVDEEGETKTIVKDTLSSIYPEAGLHINLAGEGLLTLSARYNMTSKGRDVDHWIYALAFTIPFYF